MESRVPIRSSGTSPLEGRGGEISPPEKAGEGKHLLGRPEVFSRFPRVLPWALAAIGVVAVLAVGGWVFLRAKPTAPPPPRLEDAFSALESREPAKALEIAGQLLRAGLPPEAPLGVVPLVRGLALAELAESYRGEKQRELLRQATRFLEDAFSLGVPESYTPVANLVLGSAYHRLGNSQAARRYLSEQDWEKLPAERRQEFLLLYADIWAPEDPARVHTFLERILSSKPLGEDLHAELLLRQAWVLGRMNRTEEALGVCRKIPPSSPLYARAKLLEGLLQLGAIREAGSSQRPHTAWANKGSAVAVSEVFAPAIRAFEAAIQHDNLTSRATAEALYWLGVCQADVGDVSSAEAQWRSVVGRFPTTPAGVASAWALGQKSQAEGNAPLALGWYRKALENIRQLGPLEGIAFLEWGRWLPGPAMEERVLAASRRFMETRKFSEALGLLDCLAGLVEEERYLRLKAEALRTVGETLLSESQPAESFSDLAPGLPGAVLGWQAKDPAAQGRQYLRQAGVTFLTLATKSFARREYPDYLWAAAECFRRGRSYSGVLVALDRYQEDQPIRRRPWALLYRGEALLARGKPEEALRNLEACYQQYPRDSASFQARLLAAYALAELGRGQEAEVLLHRNLDGQDLTPASREWRESLLALAELLLGRRADKEAQEYLAELFDRYPNHAEAAVARYLWAYAQWRQAEALLGQSTQEPLSAVAARWTSQASEHLQAGAAQLKELRENLRHSRSLTPSKTDGELILRNIDFALAVIQSTLSPSGEVLQQLEEMATSYGDQVETIPLLAQIALGWHKLGDGARARALMDRAYALCQPADISGHNPLLAPSIDFWQKLLALWAGQ